MKNASRVLSLVAVLMNIAPQLSQASPRTTAVHCEFLNRKSSFEHFVFDLAPNPSGKYDAIYSYQLVGIPETGRGPEGGDLPLQTWTVAKNLSCDLTLAPYGMLLCQKSPLVDNESSNSYVQGSNRIENFPDQNGKPVRVEKWIYTVFSPQVQTINNPYVNNGRLQVEFSPSDCVLR